jgi:YggT family protein
VEVPSGFSIGLLLSNVVELYSFIVIFWCLLSWFPNVQWYNQPWKTLDRIVQPVVTPFRKILPPINGIDLSPMIAMAVLQFAGIAIRKIIP